MCSRGLFASISIKIIYLTKGAGVRNDAENTPAPGKSKTPGPVEQSHDYL